jgi:nucleotide-binding universal stress UspA family protein
MKVLLAVDGSPCSDLAVDEVGSRPWPDGSTIKVLSAYELALPITPEGWALSPNYFEELDMGMRRQARSIVERASRTLKANLKPTIAVEAVSVPGAPRAVILDEAKNWGADLIVVGCHGYRAWERFLMGSVSQAVVSHAKCSVEVVRCPNHQPVISETASVEKAEGR